MRLFQSRGGIFLPALPGGGPQRLSRGSLHRRQKHCRENGGGGPGDCQVRHSRGSGQFGDHRPVSGRHHPAFGRGFCHPGRAGFDPAPAFGKALGNGHAFKLCHGPVGNGRAKAAFRRQGLCDSGPERHGFRPGGGRQLHLYRRAGGQPGGPGQNPGKRAPAAL